MTGEMIGRDNMNETIEFFEKQIYKGRRELASAIRSGNSAAAEKIHKRIRHFALAVRCMRMLHIEVRRHGH